MSRKIFLIIIAVLLTIIVGSLLYLFIFSGKEDQPAVAPLAPPTETTPVVTPTLPVPSAPFQPAVSKITQVIENTVLGFALTGQEIVYYDQSAGSFYRMPQSGGEAQPASSTKFTQVREVIWSPDKKAAIVVFESGLSYHYDLISGQSTKLMPNIAQIAWLPDGTKIVYVWQKSEQEKQLIISRPNGDDWENIKDLGYAKVLLLASPQANGAVAMLQNYSYGTGRNVYPVYQDGSVGVVNQIAGYGDHAKWSRDGQRILFEATDPESFEIFLWTVDFTGTNEYNLGVKSFVPKCVWNKTNDKLYCAVPSEPMGAEATAEDETSDNFWEINTKTGEKRKLYDESESETKFDAENLWLNYNEDQLYFTSVDNLVYVLQLE